MCTEHPLGPRDAIVAAAVVAVAGAAVAAVRTGRNRLEVVALAALATQSVVGGVRGRGHIHHTYLRPAVTGVATSTLIWHGRKTLRVAAAIHAASVAAGVALVDPCNDRPWAGAVDASLGPLLAVVAWSAGGAWPAAAAAEALAIVIAVAAHSDSEIATMASHLTWWSIASLVVVDVATYADWLTGRAVAKTIVPTATILTHTVAVGVVAMSAMGCTVLVDALYDVGVVGYIAGNFAMHYYPAIRTAWAPADHAAGGPAAAKAAAIVAIYGIAFAPPNVYGCPWPPIGYTAMLLVAVACGVVVVAAVHRRIFPALRKID